MMNTRNTQAQPSGNRGPRACTTCAKAKSRCTPGPTGDICERCHRLGKPCSAQKPALPRKRKAPKPTRVAELEKRLEVLTARVESRHLQVLPPTPSDTDSPVEGEVRQPEAPKVPAPGPLRESLDYLFPCDVLDGENQAEPQEPLHGPRHCRWACSGFPGSETNSASASATTYSPRDGGHAPSAETQEPHRSPSTRARQQPGRRRCRQQTPRHDDPPASYAAPWYYPSSREAEEYLEDFKTRVVPTMYPFVVVPKRTTAEQLRRDRPLLWKGIMMQGLAQHARPQVLLGTELLNEVVATAFLQPRRTFDLLQALQILTMSFHITAKSFQLTNLLFLMRSICVSLGLNDSTQGQDSSKQLEPSSATLEQMRAFAGVYYQVTMVFTTNKKPDAFMNTSYLEQCCRVLEENMEYESDRLAVLLVRVQQLSQSISTTLSSRKTLAGMPLAIIVQAFEHEAEQLRRSATPSFLGHAGLETQLHVAEILLYEMGTNEELSAGLAQTQRLELLWKCVTATRSMLEARFRLNNRGGRGPFICLSSFDYAYSMLVCLKLSTLNLPGWDLRLVRNEVDFDRYLLLQIQDLKAFTATRQQNYDLDEETEAGSGMAPFEDPFVRLYTKLSQLRVCVVAELAATLPPETPSTPASAKRDANAAAVDGTTSRDGLANACTTAHGGADGNQPRGDGLLGDPVEGFDQSVWQDLYRADEWETNFSALLAWGADGTADLEPYEHWTTTGFT